MGTVMSIFDRAAGFMGYTAKADPVSRHNSIPSFLGAGASPWWSDKEVVDPSLYAVQAERYTKSELVYACVNKISESGAMAQMDVFEKMGGAEPIKRHPFEELMDRPNPWCSRFQLMEGTLGSLELTGNAYWYLHPEEGHLHQHLRR